MPQVPKGEYPFRVHDEYKVSIGKGAENVDRRQTMIVFQTEKPMTPNLGVGAGEVVLDKNKSDRHLNEFADGQR